MKKLFIYLSVAVLAVAAVSCQKEMVMADGENGNVTLTIQTPEVATKAIADGMNVNIVHYEIYKNETGHKNSLTGAPLIKGTVPMSAKGASLTLNLLQGQEYVGLFWAQVNGQSYYDVTDLRDVKVAYPNETNNLTYANDEARAAFCQKKVFSTGRNVSVVLERPFAQINLGTTIADLNDDYTITLEQSSMTVTGVANTFNVAAMTAGTTANNVVFSLATVPYAFNPSETLTANNQTWAYAGMNYVLVPHDAATVDVTYSIKTDVGTVTRNVPVVPVKKNYRTNLLGNLLTQETAIEIVVDEKFNTPDQEPAPIYMAAANGGEFTLTEDVELSEPLVIQSSLTIDLNGYTITGGKEYVSGMTGAEIAAITVENGATLTIEGNGSVTGIGYYAVYAKNGTLNVKDGNFAAKTSAVQIAAATVNIEGGTFSNSSDDKRYTINCLDGNWKDGSAKVNITGGTFVGFNPESNAAEGVGTNFCAEGYKAVENGTGVYTVIPNSGVIASTSAEVSAALQQADVDFIYLNAGTYAIDMYSNFTFKSSLTFVGAEGTKVEFLKGNVRLELCKNFTIKNCEILRMPEKNWGMMVFSTGVSADGVYTISNCTFNGVGTQGIYINETVSGAVYNIENCTFNGNFGSEGAITIQGNKDAKFTVNVDADCTFNNIPVTNHDNPDGSHKICLVPSSAGPYFDFTLNTDEALSVKVSTKAPYGNCYGIAHNGGVLDGNGLTVDFDEGPKNSDGKRDNYGIMTSGGIIKNMTISGVFRGIVIMYPTEDIHIENVVFDAEDEWGNGYSINTAEGDGTHSLYVKNSIVAGWNSIGTAVKDVHYSNCTFIQGSYYTNVYGRLSKPYVNTVYENCDFCSKYYIDLSAFVGEKVTIKNCTVNGVKLTAENWTSLVAPESTCGEGQISIELKDKSYMTADNVADYVVFE